MHKINCKVEGVLDVIKRHTADIYNLQSRPPNQFADQSEADKNRKASLQDHTNTFADINADNIFSMSNS